MIYDEWELAYPVIWGLYDGMWTIINTLTSHHKSVTKNTEANITKVDITIIIQLLFQKTCVHIQTALTQ